MNGGQLDTAEQIQLCRSVKIVGASTETRFTGRTSLHWLDC
jgi:hypothetical protein